MRRPMRTLLRALGSFMAMTLVACSSAPARRAATFLPVSDIPKAVEVSKATKFTEINVSVDGVTLFVVDGTTERASLFRNGALGAPGPAEPVNSTVYDISQVPLGKGAELVAQIERQFPGSRVTTVALLDVPPSGLVWALRSQSAKGGLINFLFSSTGEPVSATPLS